MRAVRRLSFPAHALVAVALGAVVASGGGAQESRPALQVTVRVIDTLNGSAVPFSVIAMPALDLERFTGAAGTIVLPVPSAGRVRVVVRRVGFTPTDTTITVTSAPSQAFTIALTHLSFQLNEVRVVDWPPCTRPGIPRRGGDPTMRAVVEQMRENADRFALLARQYPFGYRAERTLGRTNATGVDSVERVDTILVNGSPPWRYRPGTLVAARPNAESRGGVLWAMHLPTLRDLGEQAFVDNHCFHVAGVEEKEGRPLLRLDIVAAARLGTPDVNAAVWLDPRDFQIRHAMFVLTRVRPEFIGLRSHSAQVEFGELIPFVPVMQMVLDESIVHDPSSGREFVLFERQRILVVEFRGARPEGLVDRPPPP